MTMMMTMMVVVDYYCESSLMIAWLVLRVFDDVVVV